MFQIVARVNFNGLLTLPLIFALRLDIAFPNYFGFDSFNSLSNIGPALDSGLAYLQRKYPYINWTSTYLIARGDTCQDEKTEVSDLVAEWYYRRKQERANLRIIVTGGCLAVNDVNYLAANWNILMITSGGTPVFDSLELRVAASPRYPTLLTTSFYATNYAELYFELFRSFKWTTLYFITGFHHTKNF
ncbi:hypothetical protein RvY_00130 [Ramazzottius varieornatus]|uniref:Receptor ligand binding region domain-containing protein n=1 Tax=Ramazzottius varieornatus TaxID=947166 RepID=A0A1D1UBM3_RAMVA|nr:hypothetical protein RvY_00130 [Ramazzottius varieornatus]